MPDIQAQTPDGAIHSFPDGTPPEIMDRAIQGYLSKQRNAQPTQFENERNPSKQPGFLGTIGSKLSGAASSIGQAISEGPGGSNKFPITDPRFWFGEKPPSIGMPPSVEAATDPLPPELNSTGYRLSRGLSTFLPFMSPQGMERAGDVGDTGALAAETAAPAIASAAMMYGPRIAGAARSGLARVVPRDVSGNVVTSPSELVQRAANKALPEPSDVAAYRNNPSTVPRPEGASPSVIRAAQEQEAADSAAVIKRDARNAPQQVPNVPISGSQNLPWMTNRVSPGTTPEFAPKPSSGITYPQTTPKGVIASPESTPPAFKATLQSWPRTELVRSIDDPSVPYQTRRLMAEEYLRNPTDIAPPKSLPYLMEQGRSALPWRNYKR